MSDNKDQSSTRSWTTMLDDLRSSGWMVASHNDYRLNGQSMTFWLFTHHNGTWIKGEGKTDAEALAQCWNFYSSSLEYIGIAKPEDDITTHGHRLTQGQSMIKTSIIPWPPGGYRNKLDPFDTTRFEYEVTKNGRKSKTIRPEGDGWEEIDWDRFDFHEEVLWRRIKPAENKPAPIG